MKPEASRFAVALAVTMVSFGANAATTYASHEDFFQSVGSHLTDDYENLGYQYGDVTDDYFDVFTNSGMNAIVGETKYSPTYFFTNVISAAYIGGNSHYCAGCNGSFELDFTETSVANANGVYGVGLSILGNRDSYPYVAFVTYGDDSTDNFTLPAINPDPYFTDSRFWGLTSDKQIKSIHFGGNDGLPTYEGEFIIDDLTIASGVLEPTAVDDGPISVTEGVAKIIPVGANDTNFAKSVSVTVTIPPTRGTITAIITPGPADEVTITYTANSGALGADSFVYEMTDSTPSTDSATVTLDISPDGDTDGVPDGNDNCTLVANPTQLDADSDGYGNPCDADLNNTGLVTAQDNAVLRNVLNQSALASPEAAAADLNGSGLVTAQDHAILSNRLNTAPGPSGLACAGTIPCP